MASGEFSSSLLDANVRTFRHRGYLHKSCDDRGTGPQIDATFRLVMITSGIIIEEINK